MSSMKAPPVECYYMIALIRINVNTKSHIYVML
nr:MAG TPA: hypothetical protein [Bacteriophage sp.]